MVRGRKRGRKERGVGRCMVRLEGVNGWLWMLLGGHYASREVVGRQVRDEYIY